MKRILYNKETQLLQPWSAGDAEHVVGLEYPLEEFELIQSPPPDPVPAGHSLRPTQIINVEAKTVTRGFEMVAITPLPAPAAERYQVKEYLMRNGFPLESIPAYIASVTDEGIERDVALMRWNDVNKLPKEHPLVAAVAAELNLDLDQVWGSILAIE